MITAYLISTFVIATLGFGLLGATLSVVYDQRKLDRALPPAHSSVWWFDFDGVPIQMEQEEDDVLYSMDVKMKGIRRVKPMGIPQANQSLPGAKNSRSLFYVSAIALGVLGGYIAYRHLTRRK